MKRIILLYSFLILVIVLGLFWGLLQNNTNSPIPAPTPSVPQNTSSPKLVTISVYFSNTKMVESDYDCSIVYGVPRTVPETVATPEGALLELFKGPTPEEKGTGYSSFFSEKTSDILLDIKIQGTTAYVNLKDIRAIVPNASSSCGSAQFLAEVGETIKQFGTVNKVIYAIERNSETFYEWMQLGCTEDNNFCNNRPFQL